MLYSVQQTADKLDEMVEQGEFFYFLRFGNGDLRLIDGHRRDKFHKNSPELRKELLESIIIKDKKYVLSDIAGAFDDGSDYYFWLDRKYQQAYDDDLKRIRKHVCPDGDFYHALVFKYYTEHAPEWFISFCKKAFHNKRVLLIAGDHLCGKELVTKVFNISEEVVFPGTSDAYYSLDKRMDEILIAVKRCDVIIPTIGMASRVLSKRLWNLGVEKSVIDIGVSVDTLAEDRHRIWPREFVESGGLNPYKEEFL